MLILVRVALISKKIITGANILWIETQIQEKNFCSKFNGANNTGAYIDTPLIYVLCISLIVSHVEVRTFQEIMRLRLELNWQKVKN